MTSDPDEAASHVSPASRMQFRRFAGLVVALHSIVVVFVLAGAFSVMWQPWLAWLHVFIMLYVVTIYLIGVRCPLTALENRFRRASGQPEYGGSFLGHYLGAAVPPLKWERAEPWIGAAVLLGNIAIYGYLAGSIKGG